MSRKIFLGLLVAVILVSSMGLSVFADGKKPSQIFSDIPEGYWGEDTVQWALDMGFTGYPDGTFKPDKPVTSGEWAAMMYKLFTKENYPLDTQVEVKQKMNYVYFDDAKGHWAEKYCYYNHNLSNFLHLAGDKKAYPDRPLMRWQALEATYFAYIRYAYRVDDDRFGRAVKGRLENRPLGDYDVFGRAKNEGFLFKDYTDPKADIDLRYFEMKDKDSPHWNYHLMKLSWGIYDLKFLGFLNGFEDNTLRPNGFISRIEAFKLLQSIYDYIDKDYMDNHLRELVFLLKADYDEIIKQ